MGFQFLPLDVAVASRAVFVIVSGSGGRERFWSQLNNSKTVRDRPCVNRGLGFFVFLIVYCRSVFRTFTLWLTLHRLAAIHNAVDRQTTDREAK